jgi:hypothetical protein
MQISTVNFARKFPENFTDSPPGNFAEKSPENFTDSSPGNFAEKSPEYVAFVESTPVKKIPNENLTKKEIFLNKKTEFYKENIRAVANR